MAIVIEQNVETPKDELLEAVAVLKEGESFEFDKSERGRLAVHISVNFHGLTKQRYHISSKQQPEGKARVWRLPDAGKSTEQSAA